MKNVDGKLARLRRQVDRADRQLLKALALRMEAVREIGLRKAELRMPAKQKVRWAELMRERLVAAEALGLPRSLIEKIYKTIHPESIRAQAREVAKAKRKKRD